MIFSQVPTRTVTLDQIVNAIRLGHLSPSPLELALGKDARVEESYTSVLPCFIDTEGD